MSVTITSSPVYPTTRKPARFSFSATTGHRVHLFLTDAPLASKYKGRLVEQNTGQLSLHEGDVSTPYDFEADVAGVYSFSVQEIQTPTFRGGFKGDTRGMLNIGSAVGSEQVIGTSVSTVAFGDRLTMQIGAKPNAATLVLWTWGAAIQPTTVELHGEASPAIIKPETPVAQTAVTNAAVVAALNSIPAGLNAAVALGSIAAHVDSAVVQMDGHMNFGPHFTPDPSNVVPVAYMAPTGKESTVRSVAKIIECLAAHMASDASKIPGTTVYGQGSGASHQIAGFNFADNANTLASGAPSDMQTAIVALADAYRAYEAHRVSTAYHAAPDTGHVLMVPSPLIALHILFLTITQSVSPASSPAENSGATVLIHGAGMRQG